ncbi:MAG: cell surface protein SprA [Algoriphagus aquaeductus]|uniref:T9SS outer membrane translocon Sov/SprA n=1 Tax=Algoriphagus aquaeductus TaxID=475299 RepID=UPI003879C3E1
MVKLYNKNKKLAALNAPKRPSIPGRPSTNATDTIGTPFSNGLLKFLMMLKEVTFNYGVVEGTFLPGYMPNTGLLGMDRAWSNPGWAFVFGSQNPNLRFNLAENGNMAPSPELTQNFQQNRAMNLRFTGLAEPIRDFRVTLEARKRETGDYSEIFRNSMDSPGNYMALSPNRMGSYSITTMMIGTTFAREGALNTSELFTDFENNRAIIKQRLDREAGGNGEFGINGQDVLIPSFLAAYLGKDPNTSSLNPFPKTPLPNWRLDYRGLSRLKGLSDIFSSINITHAYSSTYDVSNFSNSLQYQQGLELFNTLQQSRRPDLVNLEGQFIPIFVLNQVVLSERFAPFIGVDVLTKQRMNIAVNYNRERNLGLNFSNSQVTEQRSNDFGLTLSYTKAGMKVPFRIDGAQKILKNDLQMRLDTKIVDTQQVQRKIEEKATVTNGNLNIQLRPTISYVVNQNLNLTFYFERTINDPKVTTAYRRATTAFGGQLRFNLSQ